MKKIRSLLAMTIVMGLIANTMPANYVYAEEDEVDVDISLSVPGTFEIKIPKYITLDGATRMAEYIVGVKGDIKASDVVVIEPLATTTLVQDGKGDISATVTQEKTEWYCDELDEVEYNETTGIISAPDASAGDWLGVLTFYVTRDIGSRKGLYRDNKRVYTYEDLISWNWLTVESNLVKKGYTGLTGELYLPDGITGIKSALSISSGAFYECKGLTKVVLPTSVTQIGAYAFVKCANISEFTIPSSVNTIGDYAFQECTKLKSIKIPNSITSIGGSVFQSCTSLEQVTLPKNLTTIGTNAFYNCASLQSVEFPSSLTKIDGNAFQNCSELKNLVLPNYLLTLESYAFANCTSITEVTIPSTITTLANQVFEGCTGLTTVTFAEGYNCVARGSTFKDCTNLRVVNIPSSMTSIASQQFYNTGFETLVIPDNIVAIKSNAFASCQNLTEVTLSSNLEKVGNNLFVNCPKLTKITYKGVDYTIDTYEQALKDAGVEVIGNWT